MFKKGFTLVEIAIVIGMIGVLSGLVYVNLQNSKGVFSQEKIDADIEILRNAIVSYSNDFYNDIPEGSGCLLQEGFEGDSCIFLPVIKPYIGFFPEPEPGVEYRYWYDNDLSIKIEIVKEDGNQEVIIELPGENDLTDLPSGGACGELDGNSSSTEPDISDTSLLCRSGDPILNNGELNFDGSKWSWSCPGINGGIDSTCSVYLSDDVFACRIVSDGSACSVSSENSSNSSITSAHLMNIYSLTGSHAELTGTYENKICCEGVNLSNSCTNGTVVLRLSGVTNAHVEQPASSTYTNNACLKSNDKEVACEYVSDCTEGHKCLVSISTGLTNLHVGNCDAYATKVCCKITNK